MRKRCSRHRKLKTDLKNTTDKGKIRLKQDFVILAVIKNFVQDFCIILKDQRLYLILSKTVYILKFVSQYLSFIFNVWAIKNKGVDTLDRLTTTALRRKYDVFPGKVLSTTRMT